MELESVSNIKSNVMLISPIIFSSAIDVKPCIAQFSFNNDRSFQFVCVVPDLNIVHIKIHYYQLFVLPSQKKQNL